MAVNWSNSVDSRSRYTNSVSGKHGFTYVNLHFTCEIIGVNENASSEGTHKAALNAIDEWIRFLKGKKNEVANEMLERGASGQKTFKRTKSALVLKKAYQKSKTPNNLESKPPRGIGEATAEFLKNAIAFLTPHLPNLVGIYRESSAGTVLDAALKKYRELKGRKALKDSSLQEILNELKVSDSVGPTLCANLLKAVIRHENGLISLSEYKEHLEKVDLDQEEEVINALQALFLNLHPENRELLISLLFHFRRVAEASKTNKMDAHNLGIVFAPVLIESPKSTDGLTLLNMQQKFASFLEFSIQKTELSQSTHWLQVT
ncbi:MAG: hypothetical protein JJU12_04545 [Chlamydiales bacterium]|nr:hypothetical protein [Chlamydiales bacterium]